MYASILKIAAALLVSLDTIGAPTPKPEFPMVGVEQSIVDRTNAERARFGLAPLAVDRSLEQMARSHAAWMTNSHTMQHSHMAVAENIAWGQRSPAEALSSWMNSSGHRANILNPSYHRMGAAAFTATDGTVYWCQQFLQ